MRTSIMMYPLWANLTLAMPWGWNWSPQPSHDITRVPYASTKNGTYVGRYLPEYEEDLFLGVPYAQPPVGNSRFSTPKSLNESWHGVRDATKFQLECVGYGTEQWNYNVSEDCLYLNVVRPAARNYKHEKLPVAFWIHGGGYTQGGGSDQRYNLSFIVQRSVEIGKPMIAVNLNYRLSAWGFLFGTEVAASGQTNLGLRDQRLALQWVHENIAAFGGDATKVTIWGESAGAQSVGFHLLAYGGRDDKLFRGAVMESGNPLYYGNLPNASSWDARYNRLVQNVSCTTAPNTLQCLRQVPYATLNAAINGTGLTSWQPNIDRDFIQGLTSTQMLAGKFVHVPIISGANSDEGASFAPQGLNTSEDFHKVLTNTSSPVMLPESFAQQVLTAYPDDPAQNVIIETGLNARFGLPWGAQFRRAATYFGDETFIAGRRLTCATWSRFGLAASCYRFNAIPAGIPPQQGVRHFQEVSFVFNNVMGVGVAGSSYPSLPPPFTNKSQSYFDLSDFMSASWASFVVDQDPNSWRYGAASTWKGSEGVWPKYSAEQPQDFVFDANVTSHAEADTYRAEGMKLINDHAVDIYNR